MLWWKCPLWRFIPMKNHSSLKKSLLVAVGGASLLLQQPSNAWERHCGWYRGFYYGECEHYHQPSSYDHHPDTYGIEYDPYHTGTYIDPAPIYPTQQPLIRLCIAIVGCN